MLAPEHDLVKQICTKQQIKIVTDYCKKISLKSERDRQSNRKTISGVFSGYNNERKFY